MFLQQRKLLERFGNNWFTLGKKAIAKVKEQDVGKGQLQKRNKKILLCFAGMVYFSFVNGLCLFELSKSPLVTNPQPPPPFHFTNDRHGHFRWHPQCPYWPFKPYDQNLKSHMLVLFISYRCSGENLIKYQANSSCVIMSVILMTTLFYKAFIIKKRNLVLITLGTFTERVNGVWLCLIASFRNHPAPRLVILLILPCRLKRRPCLHPCF